MENDASELRWERDECRARCQNLERENRELRTLLRYADEAIMAEYHLRTRPGHSATCNPQEKT